LSSNNSNPPIIAIDGPSAAGKGTLADGIAAHFDYHRLESGVLYRAVANEMLNRNLELSNPSLAASIAAKLVIDPKADLRREAVGIAASKVAAYPEVRQALLQFQRNFGRNPPRKKGSVIDGRDIGTVIFPHTPYKLYLVASDEERARRRLKQLELDATHLPKIKADLMARDKQDSQRDTAPLRQAPDAYKLDSTNKTPEEALREALEYLNNLGLKK